MQSYWTCSSEKVSLALKQLGHHLLLSASFLPVLGAHNGGKLWMKSLQNTLNSRMSSPSGTATCTQTLKGLKQLLAKPRGQVQTPDIRFGGHCQCSHIRDT